LIVKGELLNARFIKPDIHVDCDPNLCYAAEKKYPDISNTGNPGSPGMINITHPTMKVSQPIK
jgi:hypothetical protein